MSGVENEQSLETEPEFGLFVEPASILEIKARFVNPPEALTWMANQIPVAYEMSVVRLIYWHSCGPDQRVSLF